MQGEMASAAGNAFRQLNDADLRFGEIEDHEGKKNGAVTRNVWPIPDQS